MQENIQENIQNSTISNLKFSSSKLYFQHQNQLLQKIWFVSPMTIDIYFKYTFQEVEVDYFIEWWEFEWLTVDHDVTEQWIIYKVWFFNPKYKNVNNLSLDLRKSRLSDTSIWPLIWWFFWWCIVFAFLFRLSSKFKLWQILFWLNIVGASILFIFYICKLSKLVYKKVFKTKKIDYWWLSVNYSNHSDALMISPEMISLLEKLERLRIIKFCYTGNCIYLLQNLHDSNWKKLKSTSKLYSEQEKATLQQKTMDLLHDTEFLSYFILK